MSNGSLRRAWIDAGLPISIATGQISFFSLQLPGIILMATLAVGAFFLRSRLADIAVVILLASIPFVDAIGFGMVYLRTQYITALTITCILAAYFTFRRFVPIKSDPPADWRLTLGLLATYALACGSLYTILE